MILRAGPGNLGYGNSPDASTAGGVNVSHRRIDAAVFARMAETPGGHTGAAARTGG